MRNSAFNVLLGASDSNFIISQFLNTPRCLFMLFLLLSLCSPSRTFPLPLFPLLLSTMMIRQAFICWSHCRVLLSFNGKEKNLFNTNSATITEWFAKRNFEAIIVNWVRDTIACDCVSACGSFVAYRSTFAGNEIKSFVYHFDTSRDGCEEIRNVDGNLATCLTHTPHPKTTPSNDTSSFPKYNFTRSKIREKWLRK